MRRVLLYGLLLLHLALLFPGAILPVNRYKLIDPDTSTPPDPDTVFFVWLIVALFALSVAAILALVRVYGKREKIVVSAVVGLTTLLVIVARVMG